MKKVQLNFTERAAQSLNAETNLRVTTTELYDLYKHPEDMQLFIQIVGDDRNNTPDIYIDDVTLKDLHYVLSQLNNAALNRCVIWLRAYNGRPLQEFATVCEAQHNDFVINNCNFRLYDFPACDADNQSLNADTIVCCKEEVTEMYYKIMNIINNNNN